MCRSWSRRYLAEREFDETPHGDALAQHGGNTGRRVRRPSCCRLSRSADRPGMIFVPLVEFAVDDVLDHLGGLPGGTTSGEASFHFLDDARPAPIRGRDTAATSPRRASRRRARALLNFSLRATKSVSQLISTSTPIFPPAWMYDPTMPSWAAVRPSSRPWLDLVRADASWRLEVAFGLDERVAAVDHAGAGGFAQTL